MKRTLILLTLALPLALGSADDKKPISPQAKGGTMTSPTTKTDAEWKKILTPEQYRILREKGTERAFTGEYWNTKDTGVYRCAGCGAELFTSDTKFDSHCGWPSFFAALAKDNVKLQPDHSHGMIRTEVLCARCGGHLGHLFDDGPAPTGQRYCINSVSIKFEKKEKKTGGSQPAGK
ncbi:MAG: peptide-methionine (R)-S-oxide reductase MsrB [Verrucomicrobia bacterium]|nr:peptide-methionine (R)-S-oxide reductase MsrB [Verrucomicrobiota bacterium]